MVSSQKQEQVNRSPPPPPDAYELWLEREGVKVHRGYYVRDARTLELSRWERRDCEAGFLLLEGQEGMSEAHVIELAPGQSLPPFRMALGEVIYVLHGLGITQIWGGPGPKESFEWQTRSLFHVPPNYSYQLVNAQGSRPARLLIFSSLPLGMRLVRDPDFFFENTFVNLDYLYGANKKSAYHAAATAVRHTLRATGREDTYTTDLWTGGFFPDMAAWDKLDPFKGRGAGGRVVRFRFPDQVATAHMSLVPDRTYKKAHRHGAGFVIVIPSGEGYSVMWPEGREKVVIPWQEGSIFVPPNRWFHQHFNVGATPARYLALHPATVFEEERIHDPERDQIEYVNEDPFIREYFESELAKRRLTSLMPPEAYKDRNYEWSYV